MNFDEDERFKAVMDSITDRLSYIILDIVNMSLDKINSNQIAMASLENENGERPNDHIEF